MDKNRHFLQKYHAWLYLTTEYFIIADYDSEDRYAVSHNENDNLEEEYVEVTSNTEDRENKPGYQVCTNIQLRSYRWKESV